MKFFRQFSHNQKGFVIFLIAILMLVIILGIVLAVSFLVLSEQKISSDILKSTEAYYAAEAGAEDALLRLVHQMTFSSPYNLEFKQGNAAVNISDSVGGSRTIISEGEISDKTRKIRLIWGMSTEGVSFNYGVQAGSGGIDMESNSIIHGNVFSNGTVNSVTGTATIDNSLIISGNGSVNDITIGTIEGEDETRVYSCIDSIVNGDLYYVSGGSVINCTVSGSENILDDPIEEIDMPISDNQINKWKNEALLGGTFNGDYTVPGGETEYLGPLKIDGNLAVENSAVLMLTGNLWITGTIIIEPGASVKLDSGYEITSGVLVSDSQITVENGAILEGSGFEGSFIMFLTTSNALLPSSPAIYVKNNAAGAVFYASQGMIRLRNNINIREATGLKIYLDNNAEINYESGLSSLLFSSGPSGSWKVLEWKEIE